MANSVYKEIRKEHDMTRDDVCDKAQSLGKPIQPERLERIENKKFPMMGTTMYQDLSTRYKQRADIHP